jgi:hypothetical protein
VSKNLYITLLSGEIFVKSLLVGKIENVVMISKIQITFVKKKLKLKNEKNVTKQN